MDLKRPREQFIYIGCDKPFNTVGDSGDSFVLPDDGNTYYIFHTREYPRERKPKYLYALYQFFGSRKIAKDPLRELCKYDRVYAIDTNCKGIAVTTVMSVMVRHRLAASAPRHVFTRSFQPTSDKPEREAWLSFIEEHNSNAQFRCCLIVDSDLGSLTAVNRKEVPLCGDVFIPDNWQLNYATSDVADDFIAVRLMRACDKANVEYLRQPPSRG